MYIQHFTIVFRQMTNAIHIYMFYDYVYEMQKSTRKTKKEYEMWLSCRRTTDIFHDFIYELWIAINLSPNVNEWTKTNDSEWRKIPKIEDPRAVSVVWLYQIMTKENGKWECRLGQRISILELSGTEKGRERETEADRVPFSPSFLFGYNQINKLIQCFKRPFL